MSRNIKKLNQIKIELENYNVKIWICAVDLSNINAANIIYNFCSNNNILIEAIINNAGVGGYGEFYNRKIDDDINMINLNIISLVKLTHLFLNVFIKKDYGRILNVSYTAALAADSSQAVYYASKSFVPSFSNPISEEIRHLKKNIKIVYTFWYNEYKFCKQC